MSETPTITVEELDFDGKKVKAYTPVHRHAAIDHVQLSREGDHGVITVSMHDRMDPQTSVEERGRVNAYLKKLGKLKRRVNPDYGESERQIDEVTDAISFNVKIGSDMQLGAVLKGTGLPRPIQAALEVDFKNVGHMPG